MLLGTLGASLLGILLIAKGINRAGKGRGIYRAGEGVIRAGYGMVVFLLKWVFNTASSFN